MANFKEEQTRNSRRLARQILGAVALLLAFIGLLTVVGWGVSGVRTLLDDTELRNEYADDLYGMVMLDPVTFDDVSTVDPSVFKQAAIWGTVYQAQKDGLGLEQYERDADTGSVMLPKLEIDTYIANLLGADYAQTVPAGSFETPEFIYQYNEEKQCYLVPVTGSVAQYTPLVEKIKTSGRQRIVTVGYVPTAFNNDNGELSLTAPTEPTKYMDYVFTRNAKRQWCLTALQESEMKVAATPTPTPTPTTAPDVQVMLENQMNASSAPAEEEGTAPADTDAAAEEAPESAASAAESAESATSEDATSDSNVE